MNSLQQGEKLIELRDEVTMKLFFSLGRITDFIALGFP